jgi:hypothetical protein
MVTTLGGSRLPHTRALHIIRPPSLWIFPTARGPDGVRPTELPTDRPWGAAAAHAPDEIVPRSAACANNQGRPFRVFLELNFKPLAAVAIGDVDHT